MSYQDYVDDEFDSHDREVFDKCQKHINAWYTHFADNYNRGRRDKAFALVSQWTAEEEREISRLGIPMLEFNKIYDYTKKIIGEARQITPNLLVTSKEFISEDDDQGLIDLQNTINTVTNFMRRLAYDSESQIAYQTAFASAIYSGYGAVHVKFAYENSETFDKKIFIEPVNVPERAFFDVNAQHPCKTDGDYCGVYYDVNKDTFQQMYPDIQFPISFPQNSTDYFSWYKPDTITVVDYYCKEYFTKKIVKLDTGESMPESELKEYFEGLKEIGYAIPNIIAEREAQDYKIMHYRLIKDHILDSCEFPSKLLPVIFMDGNSEIIEGKQRTMSFINKSIDVQRFLNYTGVAIAQGLKNSRKEQYLVTPIQMVGFEDIWKTPELQQGALPYNPDPKAPPPIKVPAGEISQSLFQHYERAEQDIQSILGIYNQNLSQPVQMNQLAINAKQQQSNIAAAIYRDNMIRAVESTGRCVLSMLPKVFDSERTISTLKHDGTSTSVKINERRPDGTIGNDLTKDIFELSIEAGTSFQQQKQAELELLTKLGQAAPQVFPLIADLIADNVDLPNRPQLVERLRTLVPPNILAKEQGKPPPKPVNQPNPQMIMAQQAMQQKQAENQLKVAALKSKQVDQQLKANDQSLEQNSQRIESARLGVEQENTQSQERQTHAENIANIYRSSVDSKGNEFGLLHKLLDLHAKSNSPKH